jgi:RHS repeat-associated protein
MTGYATGTGNRLTNDGTYTYTYDNEGNTLTKTRTSDGQTTTFTWDYRNRLTEVIVKTSGGTTLQDDRFTYDVENRRIGKNTLSGGQMWTLYDGVNPYADFNSSLNLAFRYLYGRAIDSILARWDGTNALWYLTDKLGSVRMDATTSGSVSDQLVYDSYGNMVSETSSSSGDRFKYTGREWDAEIALYFYRARYLTPADGRFESEDPSGFSAGDPDLYRYARNHPTTAIHPLGLDGFLPPPPFPAPQPSNTLPPGHVIPWEDKPKSERMIPCPCTEAKMKDLMENDPTLSITQDPASSVEFFHDGAATSFRVWSKSNTATGDLAGNQCNYDSAGDLITDGPGAGTPDLVSVAALLSYGNLEAEHFTTDVAPFIGYGFLDGPNGWETYHKAGWGPYSDPSCKLNWGSYKQPAPRLGGDPGIHISPLDKNGNPQNPPNLPRLTPVYKNE